MVALALAMVALFVALTLARGFVYVPQLSLVVGAVTCAMTDAFAATVPKLQLSEIGRAARRELELAATLQVRPLGSTSLSVTPFAGPTPVFVTVIVKPACPPAVTEAASAVFVTDSFGG